MRKVNEYLYVFFSPVKLLLAINLHSRVWSPRYSNIKYIVMQYKRMEIQGAISNHKINV